MNNASQFRGPLKLFRIQKGVSQGLEGGEQATLSFEEFPHLALSRTYCVDSIVADSACSATAYLGGKE